MKRADTWNEGQRPFIKRVAGPLFLVLVTFYLGFHAVSGERGVFALFKETRKLDDLKAELVEVHAKRATLDHKVQLMSDSSLDLDLLDEQVRRVLGMANKSEVVYFLDGKAPAIKK
jgi:cell division protein FtsB